MFTLGTLIGVAIIVTLCYWIAKGFLGAVAKTVSWITGLFKKGGNK